MPTKQASAVDTAALAGAITNHIAAGGSPEACRKRFEDFTEATAQAGRMRGLLKAIETDRVISGRQAPPISRAMVEAVVASGSAGSTTRDMLFFEVTEKLDGSQFRNGHQ